MNKPKLFFEFAIAAILLVVLYMLLAPSIASTGKPTSKDWAWYWCRDYASYAENAATNGSFTLDISKVADEKEWNHSETAKFLNLLVLSRTFATNGEDYFIKTNFIIGNKASREIVIVCEKQFNYAPAKPALWNFYTHEYAHAVGFSDGSAGKISPEEFAKLDLHTFVRLSQEATNLPPEFLGK
jgi:hypothetical protein